MNNIDLEKQIIELIPSKTMRDAIITNNHKFIDIEYVQLVQEFSKSWENKLNLLKQIKENIENKDLISYIEAYVESEINAYNKFTKKEDNYVYDVIMDHMSNYEEERFLCYSFDSIMKVIDSYKEKAEAIINSLGTGREQEKTVRKAILERAFEMAKFSSRQFIPSSRLSGA